MQLLTALLVFSLCLFPSLATAATPHVYDVPEAGAAGSQTTVLGNGWDPNATLDVYFDSTNVGFVVTDNNGSFGMALKAPTIRQNGLTIQIPKEAVPGQHWITAIERITQLQAQVQFTVTGEWQQYDWPQFHFDLQHSGFNPYENVLSPETVGNLTVRWNFKLINDLRSPVVANGAVYVGTEADDYLYAFDASTGSLRWRLPAALDGDAPAVADGVIYFSDGEQGLRAVDASSGVPLWTYWIVRSTTPAVANGVVYVGSIDEKTEYAINAGTGTLLWEYPIGSWIWGAPAVANGMVYVSAGNWNVYALDASTGTLIWTFATGGYVYSSPAVANGVVYAGSGDHNVYALNASTGALLWKYATGLNVESTPAVANGVVYVASLDANVYALDASTGGLLWKYATGREIHSSPALANGVLYVASGDNNVYALNASTGALLWKYATGGEINYSSPAVVNGMVYISSDDWNLYAFGLPNQQMSEKFSPPERPDPTRLAPNWSLQPNREVTPTLKK